MARINFLRGVIAFFMLLAPIAAVGQDDADEAPLGDLARSLRRQNVAPPRTDVIDNDNYLQLMEQAQTSRLGAGPLFSFDNVGKQFKVSSPDVTCSMSFNARATSLLTNPLGLQDLPPAEIAKLDGPATVNAGRLQISVFNGSEWSVHEITVGLTVVRRETPLASYGGAKLIPASDSASSVVLQGRQSDSTVLYHVKGLAAPLSTATFSQELSTPLAPDEEWHWAILAARGSFTKPPGTIERDALTH